MTAAIARGLPEADMEREVRAIGSRGEWLAWRREDITASRIAALFDAHPYLSRDQVAMTLRGETAEPPNSAMRRGRILEPGVAAALAEDYPDWQITKADTYHRIPALRLGCTPDYWLGDDGLIQVKTVNPHEWERWQGRPPLGYTLQTLCELLVTGRQVGKLAVMVTSSSFPVHVFDVPRHAEAEAKIIRAVEAWWREWPAVAAASAEPIAADLDDGSHRDLSGDNLLPELLAEREALKAGESATTKRLKEIDYEIRNRIGPASTAWLPGWAISYRAQHRNAYTVPEADIRVLRVKATMEDGDNGK